MTSFENLKTRAYLARFLLKLPIPLEILQDGQMQESFQKLTDLQEHFKGVHQELTELKKQSHGTAEVKTDIRTMEDEKENLTRKVERARKKVEGTPDYNEALQLAQRMRKEKERGDDLQNKIQQQRRQMQTTEQRLQRIKQQLYESKQAGADNNPQTLISRMEEDNQLNKYLISDKLPKEIEARKKTVKDLQKVALEPAMTQQDLEDIDAEINRVTSQINKLVEKRMMQGNPAKDKLGIFRQQASILAHKKETLAETVQQQRDEAASLQQELEEKRKTLQDLGGKVLKGDEYKKYVAKLRTKSNVYKKSRAALGEMRAECSVLQRTETILQKKNELANRKMSALESKKGITGFRETQDELEKVSAMKSTMDEVKHRTLDDMSEMVDKLNRVIQTKKSSLAPVVKEMRSIRQRNQEVENEFNEKKSHYESISAGLESNRAQLEQSVSALREEVFNQDSRFYYLQCMSKIAQSRLDRANNEMTNYTRGDKKKSLREIYNKKIQEQDNLSKTLREQQKNIRQNHETSLKQVTMWNDLSTLMKCKLEILQRQQNELTRPRNNAALNVSFPGASSEGKPDLLVL